tara:strand:- start:836 stop:1258 length:423 start_codon:yes stop_codon:yes gene_type:complete
MSIRFETIKDLDRENKAADFLCNMFGFNKKKLSENDIDFAIYDNERFVFFLEVKGRLKDINLSYPLPISVKKLIKIQDKKQQSVILWACNDGIIFSRTEKLKGNIKVGGRKPRKGSSNDIEFMAYYNKQINLKEIKYEIR